jgi:hypothetical protein
MKTPRNKSFELSCRSELGFRGNRIVSPEKSAPKRRSTLR